MNTRSLPRTEVHTDGQLVAWADTEFVPGRDGGELRLRLHIVGGHQPPWIRRLLIANALDRAAATEAHHLTVTAPLGDSQLLALIRDRCTHVTTRAAGATCLIEADFPGDPPPAQF